MKNNKLFDKLLLYNFNKHLIHNTFYKVTKNKVLKVK